MGKTIVSDRLLEEIVVARPELGDLVTNLKNSVNPTYIAFYQRELAKSCLCGRAFLSIVDTHKLSLLIY